MRISCFITKTRAKERGDTFDECYSQALKLCDEVIVIDGEKSWPYEFKWPTIGNHFQKGYEKATGDWILHLDCDFIIHENDFDTLRNAFRTHQNAPALSLWKYQFILPDRYNLKSRLVIAVNKGKYGDRIRFDSGGDLCQPSIDGEYIRPDFVPEARVPFYCYDKLIKTKAQIMEDCGRMERAYKRHFKKFQMGSGGSDSEAYEGWLKMQVGRFYNKEQQQIKLEDHPTIMRETIKNLSPCQWGYNGLNHLEVNNYAQGS